MLHPEPWIEEHFGQLQVAGTAVIARMWFLKTFLVTRGGLTAASGKMCLRETAKDVPKAVTNTQPVALGLDVQVVWKLRLREEISPELGCP